MPSPLRLVVLASGRGSNLQALIAAHANGDLAVEIVAVLSDKPAAHALEHARASGIPAIGLTPRSYPDRISYDHALFERIAEFKPELIVMAGFMRVVSAPVISAWNGKIINIHPSLLPKYPGLHTHQRALAAGDSQHGVSVHFVTAVLDGGPAIAQATIAVNQTDTAESLAQRLLPQEHRLLIACVKLLAQRRIQLTASGVTLDGLVRDTPLQLAADGHWI